MSAFSAARQILNAVNLSTPLGLGLARATCRSIRRGPDGLFFAEGYRAPLPHAAAFTVGNVILIRRDAAFVADNPALLAHEARHSSQYAACLGLPFLPAYAVCAVWSLWRTGDPGSRNFFERDAGLAAGGYRENAVRRPGPRRRRAAGRRAGDLKPTRPGR